MRIVTTVAACFSLALLACASQPAMTKSAAREQVGKLRVLYNEAKPKFVIQKQELIQSDDCGRATALEEAVLELEAEANLTPDDSTDLTKLRMELVEAAQQCREK